MALQLKDQSLNIVVQFIIPSLFSMEVSSGGGESKVSVDFYFTFFNVTESYCFTCAH